MKKTWIGVLLVPLLAAGALLAAFHDPAARLDTVTAAIVNGDQPVERDGQTIPLGRELAAKLVAHTGDNYTWVLTGAADAAAGLDSGKYRVAVTIPANFSRAAISTGNAAPATAERAQVDVTSSRTSNGVDPVISRTLTDAAVATLNQTVVETYLDNVYLGFNRMHDQLGDAADGAGRVSDGARQVADGNHQLVVGLGQLATGSGALADGTDRLSAGASTLAGGTERLRDGAATLATGTGKLATGASRLATGAGRLEDGTNQLAGGLSTLRKRTAALPAQTRELADGAQRVADGNQRLADTVVPIANEVVTGIDRLPDLTSAARQARELADQCQTPADACARLREIADKLVDASGDAETAKAGVRDRVVEVRDGITDLADGAQRVADGADRLADQTPQLAGGIKQAATGAVSVHRAAGQLADGAGELRAGAGEAAHGAAALRDGARRLTGGADQLAAGARDAASGADHLTSGVRRAGTAGRRLADGSTRLAGGASDLAGALDDGSAQVPSYSAADREHLRAVAASPIAATGHGFDDLGGLVAGPIVALVLWLGALLLPQRGGDPLTWRGPTWRLVMLDAKPLFGYALGQALVVTAAAEVFLRLGPWRLLALLGVDALIAVVFALVVRALVVGFGGTGRLLGVVVPVIALATVVVSGVPATLATVASYLPTYGPVIAVRALTAHGGAAGPGIALTLGWLVIGVLGVLCATAYRRTIRMVPALLVP
ncbi:YhgE/Pip domain-containing protein [Actinoplanes oblitus]|uniref:YhgE/Pip domain-containing protein n=1 Tax=Actinoplanes oblitus TaxID=3040509 RepID=A0ABY8WHP0_9ACTN|nr:YhgE/Pip domain-containing protein [Actinoplanes oblitus]WIM97012.1 YhgE/Pip domain-containing protein [Actinoplanes oblitus]